MSTTRIDPGAIDLEPEPHGSLRAKRLLARLIRLKDEAGTSALLFAYHAFLLLVCYYIVKTLREPLLLLDGSAELKSFAYALIAVISLAAVPLYSGICQRVGPRQLTRWVTVFFMANLVLLVALGACEVSVGFAYFVWTGVFGVTMVAQFWALATHVFGKERGRKSFPLIMAGATAGALVGPLLTGALFEWMGPWGLTAVATALLGATLPLLRLTSSAAPTESLEPHCASVGARRCVLGGLRLVFRDRFLLLLAGLVVLLNCVNTTGDYMLTGFVLDRVDDHITSYPAIGRDSLIADFYSKYYLVVNALGLVIQVGLVARLLRWLGVGGALFVLPLMALVGYSLLAFIPIFTIIHLVKIAENSSDYSIMNTTRQLLYLPLPNSHRFEGKTTIETLFWRLGDVLQAVLIFLGIRYLDFGYQDFAYLNVLLILLWIVIAGRLAMLQRNQLAPACAPRCNRLAALTSVALLAMLVPAFSPRGSASGDEPENPCPTVTVSDH